MIRSSVLWNTQRFCTVRTDSIRKTQKRRKLTTHPDKKQLQNRNSSRVKNPLVEKTVLYLSCKRPTVTTSSTDEWKETTQMRVIDETGTSDRRISSLLLFWLIFELLTSADQIWQIHWQETSCHHWQKLKMVEEINQIDTYGNPCSSYLFSHSDLTLSRKRSGKPTNQAVTVTAAATTERLTDSWTTGSRTDGCANETFTDQFIGDQPIPTFPSFNLSSVKLENASVDQVMTGWKIVGNKLMKNRKEKLLWTPLTAFRRQLHWRQKNEKRTSIN